MKVTPMDEAGTNQLLVCRDCGAQIECCEFCERDACPEGLCYGCVIVTIGQEIPQPHAHGG
jgi:hypothetical protein